jgi:hypothetical protein
MPATVQWILRKGHVKDPRRPFPTKRRVPFYTCLYAAQPEEKLCEWMDLPYCVP